MLRFLSLSFALLVGCAPSERLTFPDAPVREAGDLTWYATSAAYDGPDFALRKDPATGRVEAVWYDDDRDGIVDRVYRLADYREDHVPHLIVLLDSIPFNEVAKRYEAGDFRWFEPPQKVIAPFPSLTEVCYTDLTHAPPRPGNRKGTDRHARIEDRYLADNTGDIALAGRNRPPRCDGP